MRIGKLTEISKFSEESFLPKASLAAHDCVDLGLKHHTNGVKICNGAKEDIGVIACQGVSSIYFIVATYTGEQMECDGKVYNKGDLINEAWFSDNPLPEQVLHAPATKAAYDYARENGIHPNFADSKYNDACKSAKSKPKVPTSTNIARTRIPTITNQDKNDARRNLQEKYREHQFSWIHFGRRKKLKDAYYLYCYRIDVCDDKRKLDDLLKDAQEEFDAI